MRKGQFFITGYERQENIPRYKVFVQTETSLPTEKAYLFSDEIILPGSNGELIDQPLDSVPARCTKYLVHITVFGGFT